MQPFLPASLIVDGPRIDGSVMTLLEHDELGYQGRKVASQIHGERTGFLGGVDIDLADATKVHPFILSVVVIRLPQFRHSRRRLTAPPQARRV